MQALKNELKVYRGESFTIDKILVNRDGTPYVISSKLVNPHFLISVSNTQYSQQNRYVKNYWLTLDNFPRFESTEIFDIRSIKNSVGENSSSLYTSFEVAKEGILQLSCLSGYLNGEPVEIHPEEYAVCTDGVSYKYWKNDEWYDYQCRIVKTFTTEDTKEWISQNYFYSIQLVTGNEVEGDDAPIVVQSSYPILPPTAIKVINYVQGDSVW